MQNTEQKLIKAIETVIHSTNTGINVNDAIYKVAMDEGFGPGSIETIVAAYNKSKTANMLKQAAADDFELADAHNIINRIYNVEPTVEKTAALQFPTADYSKADLQYKPVIQKVASEDIKPTEREAQMSIYKYAKIREATQRKLDDAVAEAQYHFSKSVENVLAVMRPMPKSELQKVANIVVNGYNEQESGRKFVELCLSRLNRTDIKLQKTASTAVFPVKEPYLSIAKVFEYAQKLSTAKNSLVFFSKEAAPYSIAKDIGANMLTNVLTSAGGNEPVTPDLIKTLLGKSKGEGAEDLLDPEYYNKLKTLDAKRNIMELALYDKQLKKYDLPMIVDAYNDVVELNPFAYKNKALLKNLVLAHIESGGVRGLYELGTEMSIARQLDDRYKSDEQLSMARRKEDADRKAAERDEAKLELDKKRLKATKAEAAEAKADRAKDRAARSGDTKARREDSAKDRSSREATEKEKLDTQAKSADMQVRARRASDLMKLVFEQDPNNQNVRRKPAIEYTNLSDDDKKMLFSGINPQFI